MSNRVNISAVENHLFNTMASMLRDIYSNKSSDEYKSHGDITLSSEYSTIEKMVADLSTLKKFPSTDAKDLKILFNTLHRPIFKKMVSEYIIEPNERNTVFTTTYTVGFRVLVGELSRIFSSTEATDKGIVYKPDKISRRHSMMSFIRVYNSNIESRIDEYIKTNKNDTVQEGFMDAVVDTSKYVLKAIPNALRVMSNLFVAAKELNPISLINAILTTNYNKKVAKFENVATMYQATKDAYDEYMRIPESQRNKKIESRYMKNIDKYNIKMNNLKAQIEHYDQRSIAESSEKNDETKNTNSGSTKTTNKPTSSSPDDTDGYDF